MLQHWSARHGSGSRVCWETRTVFDHQLLFVFFIIMNNLYTCMNVLICGF